MVTTTFQHLLWPQLGCLMLRNYLIIGSFTLILRPLVCLDCGFESRRGHGCLSVVNVVCCQVEVSTTGRSLVQRSHKWCVCVSLGVIKRSTLPLYLKGVGGKVRLRKQELKKRFPLLNNFIFIVLILCRVVL